MIVLVRIFFIIKNSNILVINAPIMKSKDSVAHSWNALELEWNYYENVGYVLYYLND